MKLVIIACLVLAALGVGCGGSEAEPMPCDGATTQAEKKYVDNVRAWVPLYIALLEQRVSLASRGGTDPTLILDEDWIVAMGTNLGASMSIAADIATLDAPESLAHIHELSLPMTRKIEEGARRIADGIDNLDGAEIESGTEQLNAGENILVEMGEGINQFCATGVSGNTQVPQTPIPPTPAGPATSFADGTHLVGGDIAPGTYYSSSSYSGGCYWERLSGFSGDLDDVITNGFTESPRYVEIRESDLAFLSEDCGWWELQE